MTSGKPSEKFHSLFSSSCSTVFLFLFLTVGTVGLPIVCPLMVHAGYRCMNEKEAERATIDNFGLILAP